MKNLLLTIVVLLCSLAASAQIISGKITGEQTGLPIPDAEIFLQGSLLQTHSNAAGEFIINVGRTGACALLIRKIGFEDSPVSLTLQSNTTIKVQLKGGSIVTDEVNVSSTRAGTKSGMAYTNLNKEDIQKMNLGQDVPYVLQLLPSVVVTSDAGTGVGYTGIRIRGSDPSRINVTINGVPINDAESQGMYWVDLPDFASSAENIQVQRGAGSSTNGAGAFGGSINILSNSIPTAAYGASSNSFGSYNTIKNNVSFGSGLLKNNFAFEGRLSRIKSDGYVDRGASDLKSYYFSGGYYGKKTLIRFNMFSGKEITYQSWYGVPESRIKNDVTGMQNYIINNGLDEEDAANLLNSGRTYNYYTYDNQVDDYQQDYYQLLTSTSLSTNWIASLNFHYTKGKGIYEEFKKGQSLQDYLIDPVITTNDTINESDLIRRKWLDNDFYGATWNITGNIGSNSKLLFGGAANQYAGAHFGEVVWAQFAGTSDIRHRYYDNDATKNDINAFVRYETSFNKLHLFADAQVRSVNYKFTGLNDDGSEGPQNDAMTFFNPKAGVSYDLKNHQEVYASVSVANKEPNRDDYVESTGKSRPLAESLTDAELGYRYFSKKFSANVNAYYMSYKNQLVLTGQVNDVGNYTRSNIKESFRSGIELIAAYQPINNLTIDGNLTLSMNKLNHFIEYTDTYDANYEYIGQSTIEFKNTDIAFSPSVIAMGSVTWSPIKNLELRAIVKHVGKQYLDNTENDTRSIAAYSTVDTKIGYSLKNVLFKEIRFDISLNNILDALYESNGYTYGYFVDGSRTQENFYYPQAPFNVLGQVTVKF
ncbi:MAG TPA: TonB-dependent receptor [Bacteroidia bacterium]|nr:TonB-dependent receptor [Bacteroidia bacterium]